MKNSNNLLERIKSEGIEPTPKWQFVSKQWTVWIIFILSILLGSLAFSVILFSIQQTDFDLLSHISHSKLELILGLLPFFWLISLLIFLGVAFYSIQYSKKAYKFSTAKLVGISTAMSILLGTLYFIGGGASKLEQSFAVNLSLYEGLEKKKTKLWTMPESGYLSGNIKKLDAKTIELKDSNGKIWIIDYFDAFVAPVLELIEGEKIKIIGKINGENKFIAEEIRPWGGRRKRVKK